MASQTIFLGYARLSDFLDELERQSIESRRPDVYLMPVADRIPWKESSLGTVIQTVTAQAVLADGEVAYVRVVVGKLMTNNGQPCEPKDAEAIELATASLHRAMEGLFVENGYHVARATVATPRDLVFLQGDADLFGFDRATGLYSPK
jgi:hypothetical protein